MTSEEYNSEAMSFEDSGDHASAEKLYLEAIERDPKWSVPCYNLGLLYKIQRRWPESLLYNRRATELDPEDEAAWWNLGIAATAVGDWRTAREAWRGFGLEIPAGDGPVELDYGLTPIRLDPDGEGEVAWCSRIDPARAIIRSVPLPATRRRFGDLLLHDGVPTGKRWSNGRQVSVFDEIEVLEPSDFSTFSTVLEIPGERDRKDLADAAFKRGLGIDDWTTIEFLCRECSEGTPHEHEDEPEPDDWASRREIGIAAKDQASAEALLNEWVAASSGRRVVALGIVLAKEESSSGSPGDASGRRLGKGQAEVCERYGVEPVPPDPWEKLGVSRKLKPGVAPIVGIRHKPENGTCGWYIYGGEEYTEDPDFYEPLRVVHIVERCPEVIPYLALPPGWGFEIAGDREEVWFDEEYLED